MAEELERIYIIPLRKNGYNQSKAAPTAIKRVKNFLTRHMKVGIENIWIDDSLNKAIWAHGKFKMPNKIRVKAVKFDDGVVEAYLPELEFKKSRRELLREEREKKEPILRKEKKWVKVNKKLVVLKTMILHQQLAWKAICSLAQEWSPGFALVILDSKSSAWRRCLRIMPIKD